MYSGTEDPYDYIVVHFYDDYLKTENPNPQVLLNEMFKSEEVAAFMKKACDTRTQVKVEY